MAHSYRKEPDLPFGPVLPAEVRAARCGDPTYCTLGLVGVKVIGVPVLCVIEDETMKVRITWTASDPQHPERQRFHKGYLTPSNRALQILMLTDHNKTKLIRKMPENGYDLIIKEHQSRITQVRTEAEKRAERDRRQQLAELREHGLAPAAKPRPPRRAPLATTRGMRGTVPAPARYKAPRTAKATERAG